MRKVRLQAVVSTVVANRLKEEADKRGTSVSALLAIAADQLLAPKKAPPLPQKYATEREFQELKSRLDQLLGAASAQGVSVFPLAEAHEEVNPPQRVNSGLFSRRAG